MYERKFSIQNIMLLRECNFNASHILYCEVAPIYLIVISFNFCFNRDFRCTSIKSPLDESRNMYHYEIILPAECYDFTFLFRTSGINQLLYLDH